MLNFKEDAATRTRRNEVSVTSTESSTAALLAFAKPKTGKDIFAATMNDVICRRVRQLIEEVQKQDDEYHADEDDEDHDQEEDDDEDEDNYEEDDEFFETDLALVRKVNCNRVGCYQRILGRMWGTLSDNARQKKMRHTSTRQTMTSECSSTSVCQQPHRPY